MECEDSNSCFLCRHKFPDCLDKDFILKTKNEMKVIYFELSKLTDKDSQLKRMKIRNVIRVVFGEEI